MKYNVMHSTEAETIKPRTFTLELSDSELERLYEKAYESGTTPGEVLAGFVGDLVGGIHQRGRDERDLASAYFDRCCYDIGLDRDFLSWALSNFRLEEIADCLDTIDMARDDLAYYAENPDEAQPENVDAIKDALTAAEKELTEIYNEYAEGSERAQALPDGIAAIKNYLDELQAMKERGRV